MASRRSRQIVVAGGGIAGLTAALALAQRGFAASVFEQAARFEPFGAGLQLSPNATHLLDDLGVMAHLQRRAVEPAAVLLRDAATLNVLARIPLGAFARQRWDAPYIAVHRADLHAALLNRVVQLGGIEVINGARIAGISTKNGEVLALSVGQGDRSTEIEAEMIVGADGVWSTLRERRFGASRRRFSGMVAWRATIAATSPAGDAFAAISTVDCVTTFLHPRFHLVAYPVSGGATFNLVAVTNGTVDADGKAVRTDISVLKDAMRGTPPALTRLVDETGAWTAWPLNTVDQDGPWTRAEGVALIGDAAHAMTPFAAQGAAMAIEDAVTLAQAVSSAGPDLAGALSSWEATRKARVRKVARRGALNKLAWNASGPLALGRNLLLRLRSPESLAADLDWLYGWRMGKAA